MKVILKIENSHRGRALLEFLKQLPFVEIEEKNKKKSKSNLDDIFGIWKNRNITLEEIRQRAWGK